MRRPTRLITATCLVALAGCGLNSQSSTTNSAGLAEKALRNHSITIKFSAWRDTVQIDSGVTTTTAADGTKTCGFLTPTETLSDGTVRWRPMHTYWVLVAAAADQVPEYRDVFFPGDVINAPLVTPGAVALRPLTDTNAKFVKITDITLSDDKSLLTFNFAVHRLPTVHAIAVRTSLEADSCVTRTYRCSAAPCDATALTGFEPMSTITIVQGALGMPKDIEFE